jgi:hypothetical protein
MSKSNISAGTKAEVEDSGVTYRTLKFSAEWHNPGRASMIKLNAREKIALRDAVNRPGGWGLFNPKTTAKLAQRGYFVKELHPAYGMLWRITAAGRHAISAVKVE